MTLTPTEALEKYFGFSTFREGQESAIRTLLKQQNTLLVMPTGSGKSLAYQLPALMLPGLTLVISPLIALMKDQVDALVERGLPATYINSTLPAQEAHQRMRAVREGHVKLLYVAPERLRSRQFTQALANVKISLLAVDEAHCISQWGHDFRPDYLQIGPTWQAMGRPTLLATTATATPQVQQDVIAALGTIQCHTIVTGFNRPNLTFRVNFTSDARTKLQTIQALLSQGEGKALHGSAIIYAGTRRSTEEVAQFINDVLGIPTGAYHGGLDRHQRHQVQTDFMADRLKVVVATNAFGMGVDKPDVRMVIHYAMPATVEAYYQEAGRAGRDGQPAECVLLFATEDLQLQQRLINNDTPELHDLHDVYHRLNEMAMNNEVHFVLRELAEMTGLYDVKLRVVLSELERAGGLIHLGDQHGYSQWRVLPLEAEALTRQSHAIKQRSKIRHDLLATMLDYVHLTTCRRQFLLNYFGDVSPPSSPRCCDNHGEQSIDQLPKAVSPQEWFPLIVLETIRSLQHRPVGRGRLAQLLSGSQSQKMRQFGYDRHKFYGKLSTLSQVQINDLILALIEGRYVRVLGSELPVLGLSPLGEQALAARAALPVRVPEVPVGNAVDQWQNRTERSDTVTQTFTLFQEGLAPSEIAAQRELTLTTIYGHLARLIGDQKIELHHVVSPEIAAQILVVIEQVGGLRLTPIKAKLPDTISFEEIKCVLAAYPEERLPQNDHLSPSRETEPSPPIEVDGGAPEANDEPLPQNPLDLIILAVTKLGGTLGRTGLAQFLSGSKQAWLETFADHSLYGCLPDLSQRALLDMIDALIADGKLQSTGGRRPKVRVPEQGVGIDQTEIVIEASSSEERPSTQERPSPQPSPKERGSEINAPEDISSPVNQDLLETLRTWRTGRARIQKVPPYIIFSNKALETIAQVQPTSLADLGEIAGVGPAKLEQYGEAVLAMISGGERMETSLNDDDDKAKLIVKEEPASEISPVPTPFSNETTHTPRDYILQTIEDLDGLLTLESLIDLLTAAPGDVVSFSDHSNFGRLNDQLTPEATREIVMGMIAQGTVQLTGHQRLVVPD